MENTNDSLSNKELTEVQKETVDLISSHVKGTVKANEDTVNSLHGLSETIEIIVDKIVQLYKIINILVLVINILIWRIFIYKPLVMFLGEINVWFSNLQLPWQIFVATLISTPFLGAISILIAKPLDRNIKKFKKFILKVLKSYK